jgi:type IV pilus assembly protein PilF
MSPFIRILAASAAALGALGLAGCQTTTTVNGVTVASTTSANDVEARKRAQSRLALATGYYQQRQYPVAIEETRRVLQIDPGNAGAYGLLGLIYMELDDRREAEANLTRALKLEPDNPEWLNNYGWFLCRGGREKESIEYFDRAAQNKLYATPALALQNAGVCLMRVRDMKGAEQYLRRSFELDAGNPVVKFNLSRVYLAERQLERAQFYFGLLDGTVDASPETLWLGLRIARARGDGRTERQLGDELLRRFPSSVEAASLRRGAFSD